MVPIQEANRFRSTNLTTPPTSARILARYHVSDPGQAQSPGRHGRSKHACYRRLSAPRGLPDLPRGVRWVAAQGCADLSNADGVRARGHGEASPSVAALWSIGRGP